MNNLSARHQLVCAIVHGYPDAVLALGEALGVLLPDCDQVVLGPDSHYLKNGRTIYTDATVRLLRNGKPVFFASVEMQREYKRGKYATLHAYHGSGVRNLDVGGHLFVLSDKPGSTARFRAEDATRRPELTFAASFHSGGDLGQLRDKSALSLGARAIPAALADFDAGVPGWAHDMLMELTSEDPTLADLYFQTMMEEAPKMTMLEAGLSPEMLERLRELESFRDYEARITAELTAKAQAEAEARVNDAEARVKATVIGANLKDFLVLRGDKPSKHALAVISACRDANELDAWLKRAYLGETSAQLFPEPAEPEPATSLPAVVSASSATPALVRDSGAVVEDAQRGLHDRERLRRAVRGCLAAADHEGAARPDDLAGHHEPSAGCGREEVDRVGRREDGRVRRHDRERRVPAGAVQHGGHGAAVEKPVLLGEPVVIIHGEFYPPPLDRRHPHAERVHHRLPFEAGPDAGRHRLRRLGVGAAAFALWCWHRPIVSAAGFAGQCPGASWSGP